MNLTCLRPSCKRTLAVNVAITSGTLTLVCRDCTGRTTYTFVEGENSCVPHRSFQERARAGESSSKLVREPSAKTNAARSATDTRSKPVQSQTKAIPVKAVRHAS